MLGRKNKVSLLIKNLFAVGKDRPTRQHFWSRWFIVGFAIALIFVTQVGAIAIPSNYELTQAAAFNQVEQYPITPLPTSPEFRPNGDWLGRLILPTATEYANQPEDWVWFEVWHAPATTPDLLGKKIQLTWQPTPTTEAYVDAVTRDVTFSEAAEKAFENGTVLPIRLNGRKQVGPLQSLAGSRPEDDVTVRLVASQTELIESEGQPVLQTQLEPWQTTGREYGLVKILGPDDTVDAPRPEVCPGESPCPSEYFRVQHFDPVTRAFDGAIATVRIPQQPMVRGERFFSTVRDLTESPAGDAGWYIYGARDGAGLFTVQALQPRALFQLQPQDVILGRAPGLRYIDRDNWQNEPERKGTIQTVLVSPDAPDAESAIAQWQRDDYALVLHLFGGIGGENPETIVAGTVPGHFSYGLARVIEEPIAQELQFEVLYQQVYAHNPNGILSGTQDWASYNGDMQRGWAGIRPVSDVVVKLDNFIEPFQFGDYTLSLFGELLKQAQIMAARYRVGDGTGRSTVTPAISCVQDSNQALFIAIAQIREQVNQHPEVLAWIEQHPDDPEIQRITEFTQVGRALSNLLTPYGIVRPDWEQNAETLAGITPRSELATTNSLINAILSWQTMMPRWGHDAIARLFLQNGAQLWFLRTNIIGGDDPAIAPLPPTTLLGLVPVVGRAVQRLIDAVVMPISWRSVAISLGALVLYGAIALPYGFRSGFLERRRLPFRPVAAIATAAKLLFLPALLEELIFRVFLLPHPIEGVRVGTWLLWGAIACVAFTLYHLLTAYTVYPQAKPVLTDARVLGLASGLGIVLTGLYGLTGSLWLIVGLHWVVVTVWILGFGGEARLRAARSAATPPGEVISTQTR